MKILNQHQTSRHKEWTLVIAAFVFSLFFLYGEWQLSRVHKPVIHGGFAWLIEAVQFYHDGISNRVRNGGKVVEHNFNLYYTPNPDGPLSPPSIYDPVFYAAFWALLWKVVGGPNLWSIKILNIILFSLLMIWLFRILQYLFVDQSKAFTGSIGVLLFFPLLYTNILTPRDAHHYYFFVIFLYFMLTWVLSEKKISFLIPGALLCVFCQWARPALLSSLVVFSVLFLMWGWLEPFYNKKIIKSLSVFWLGSILLFWIPFCTFNKITYGQFYVVPHGEGLLGSLYGLPFPDGDKIEHTTGKFLERKTGKYLMSGAIEGDEECLKLYKKYNTKFPFHRFKCMLVRLKTMLWYDLPWREYDPYTVTTKTSRWFKLKLAFTSPWLFLEFLARMYMRILLTLAYLGIAIAFVRKEYKLLIFMILGVVLSSGYSWLFHIEDRVLAVHNWPFGLFAGYFIVCCYELLVHVFKKKKNKGLLFKFG